MLKRKNMQDKKMNSRKTNKQGKHNESQISNDPFYWLCAKLHNAMCKNKEQGVGPANVSAKQCN